MEATMEKTSIQESLNEIKAVVKSKKNINIENIIGLVSTAELEATAEQVAIRFSEEKTDVQMNMIAFD